ncbi:MAG: septum formation initiator family protein [Lachnospiraceae bacterium]|nr:septum formation initiator family protein [Lachnospiraceae bacterium]
MKKRTKGRIKEFEQTAMEKPQAQTAPPKKKQIKVNKGRIILTVIVVILIAVVGMSVKTVFDLQAEQRELKEANKKLNSEKASLKEELESVNDKEYIEEQARIQLKLIKPGEILYILEDGQDTEDDSEKDN